jgi:hypothetical protein
MGLNISQSYSKDREILKIIFVLSQISGSFYQDKGFLLLKDIKNIQPSLREQIVVLQPSILEFVKKNTNWKYIKGLGFENHIKNMSKKDGEYLELFNNCFKNFDQLYDLIPDTIDWKEYDEDTLKKIIKVLISLFNLEGFNLYIHPTSSGTIGSYTYFRNSEIHVYSRLDASIEDLIECIFGGIVKELHPGEDWETYQGLQEFIVYKTVIKDILGLEKNFISTVKEPDMALMNESNFNYLSLGFPVCRCMELANGAVSLIGYGEVDFLSKKEMEVLISLIENEGSIVSFDCIADILWRDESVERYSLQAISKVIERIRKKLDMYGCKKQVIYTRRNEGYVYVE